MRRGFGGRQGDLKAFLEAFPARMEGALPGRVAVERRRNGLFSRHTHVVSIAISTDDHVYTLRLDGPNVATWRSKAVRGVTLRSEQMSASEWLAALNDDIEALTQQAGAAHDVIHRFLMS